MFRVPENVFCLNRSPFSRRCGGFAVNVNSLRRNGGKTSPPFCKVPGPFFIRQKQKFVGVFHAFPPPLLLLIFPNKLLSAVLAASFFLICILGGCENSYAGSDRATSIQIAVSATVLERTSLKILHQEEKVFVTDLDILRGYLDVPAATSVVVKSNNPRGYSLLLEKVRNADCSFDAVIVFVGGKELQLLSNGGYLSQPYVRGEVKTDIGYRFVLSKNSRPGTYRWPLAVSVSSR